jgi:hypothetical protein
VKISFCAIKVIGQPNDFGSPIPIAPGQLSVRQPGIMIEW